MVKCASCNYKIKDIFIEIHTCKCKGIYCNRHKLDHNCLFDYKKQCKENLQNNLHRVVSNKVTKI